jgi:hypothetical protein
MERKQINNDDDHMISIRYTCVNKRFKNDLMNLGTKGLLQVQDYLLTSIQVKYYLVIQEFKRMAV